MACRVLFLSLLIQIASWAGLIGTTVTLNFDYDIVTFTDSFTVGAGLEIACPSASPVCAALPIPGQTVDVGDFNVRYDNTTGTGAFFGVLPNRFRFTGLALPGPLAGITLSTNIAGLDASRVSFTGSTLTVEMHDLKVTPGSFFDVGLSEVPEPSTFALAGLALGALLLRRPRL